MLTEIEKVMFQGQNIVHNVIGFDCNPLPKAANGTQIFDFILHTVDIEYGFRSEWPQIISDRED